MYNVFCPLLSFLLLQLRDFSKIDIKKAYYCVAPDGTSKKLTATITPLGLMRYNRLPIGMKDSVAMFQKLVSQALVACNNMVCYIDDVLVFGATKETHGAAIQ